MYLLHLLPMPLPIKLSAQIRRFRRREQSQKENAHQTLPLRPPLKLQRMVIQARKLILKAKIRPDKARNAANHYKFLMMRKPTQLKNPGTTLPLHRQKLKRVRKLLQTIKRWWRLEAKAILSSSRKQSSA